MTLNTVYISVTWPLTIREEGPAGAYNHLFLRGWDSTHQGWLISPLRLKINDISLAQINNNVVRTVMRKAKQEKATHHYTSFALQELFHKESWVSVIAIFILKTHKFVLFLRRHLKHLTPRQQGQEWICCCSTLLRLSFTYCHNNFKLSKKQREWAQKVVEVTCPERRTWQMAYLCLLCEDELTTCDHGAHLGMTTSYSRRLNWWHVNAEELLNDMIALFIIQIYHLAFNYLIQD